MASLALLWMVIVTSTWSCSWTRAGTVKVNRSCVILPGVYVDDGSKTPATPRTVCGPVSQSPSHAPERLTAARYRSSLLDQRSDHGWQGRFDHAAILELHNFYRSTVEPPAADMSVLGWNDEAAMLAQQWAQNCVFEHGFPNHPLSGHLGQNLYRGPDTTGLRATRLWFEERAYYDIRSLYCRPNEMCGHYTQGAWAESKFLGCGIAQCPTLGNLIVCHYYPKGNYKDTAPYQIGTPCSLCSDNKSGGLCFNNTCVSQSLCQTKKLKCNCPLHCHNCGSLDENRCRCRCKPGWDQLDCSEPCIDAHQSCGRNPGFPDIRACTMDDAIKKRYCRRMCHQCNAIDDLSSMTISQLKGLCCVGKVCESGYVLNRYCTCEPKCPGPACGGAVRDGKIASSPSLRTLLALTLLLYFFLQPHFE